jgi:hypothetical protein
MVGTAMHKLIFSHGGIVLIIIHEKHVTWSTNHSDDHTLAQSAFECTGTTFDLPLA